MLVSDDVPENLFPVPSKQSTSLLGALYSPFLFFLPELDGSADILAVLLRVVVAMAVGGGSTRWRDGSGLWAVEK